MKKYKIKLKINKKVLKKLRGIQLKAKKVGEKYLQKWHSKETR